jgi:hypothetical protein
MMRVDAARAGVAMAWIEIGGTLFNLVNARRVHIRKLNEVSRALMIDEHEAFVGSLEEVRCVYAAVIEKLAASSELVNADELEQAVTDYKASLAVEPKPE